MIGLRGVYNTVSLALSNRKYMAVFVALSVLLTAAYGFLLANSSLNLYAPKILFGLNAYSISASIAMGILLSLSIVLSAFVIMNGAEKSSRLEVTSLAVSVLPVTLCCTTVVPSVLAFLGLGASTIIGVTGTIQGPLAVYEPLFIAVSLSMLVLSIYLNSGSISKINRCCVVEKVEK
ncbi:MAG: hypothetical protein M1360_00405 [Candidatus Marsarchaeota archaeon]|jgi:hypothetical protein|nr:hypothetical protein [Candidatus Marsarchaeota archaeon]MCL5418386.1 hypothetical protein [Candidatus Marsarchaeota archaeon]